MNKQTQECSESGTGRRVGSAVSIAAMASGLLWAPAWSAPGDFDPTFGSMGRISDLWVVSGHVWSIQPHGDGYVLGGGGYRSLEDITARRTTAFVRRFAGSGLLDATYAAAGLGSTIVRDIVLQSDGRVTGVGHAAFTSQFLVFRLNADGVLDTTFGDGGLVRSLGDVSVGGPTSIVLDDADRSVIAGMRAGRLAVVRLLSNGAIDTTFGAAGLFEGREMEPGPSGQMVRVPGGYRVALTERRPLDDGTFAYECQVVALRDDGTLDTRFGESGYAELDAIVGGGSRCADLAAQSDGRLVLGGNVDGRGFVVRLHENGGRDAGFSAPDMTSTVSVLSALAVASDGSVLVAGREEAGIVGAPVLRLEADGDVDLSFGNGGVVWIDVTRRGGQVAQVVHDVLLLTDGRAVLAGGNNNLLFGQPFVARLLGDSGADSPGVIGMERYGIAAPAGPGQVIVSVRRSGGSAGAVSVAYRTEANWFASSSAAEAGQDFVATSGRLSWSDGDYETKRIAVQLLGDDHGYAEDAERFDVLLSDVEGGSGLGTTSTMIEIAGHDGLPRSLVGFDPNSFSVVESQRTALLNLRRDGGSTGAIVVTLAASPGPAEAGSDYRFDTAGVEWADGDASTKTVAIPLVDDDLPESSESFTVRIVSATSGAAIGFGTAWITIEDDDSVDDPADDFASGNSRSGGGRFDFLALLLLGLAGALRVVRSRARGATQPWDPLRRYFIAASSSR